MKNSYCDLSQKQINALPERFQGFLLSPFQFNLRNGMVGVPEDTFKEMIEIIAEYALQSCNAQKAPNEGRNQAVADASGDNLAVV